MTGTACGHEVEWRRVYGLRVVVIPPRIAPQRVEYPTLFFRNQDAKLQRIISETRECHECGQPVLIGMRTIEQSRSVSKRLTEDSIPHQVLNRLQDEDEAFLIQRCGTVGAVTVATNLAGRGTDIKPDKAAIEAGGLHVIGF